MFCAAGLSNGYWFDRHSYSAFGAVSESVLTWRAAVPKLFAVTVRDH